MFRAPHIISGWEWFPVFERGGRAEAQTGGRLGPEPGGAGGGLDPAGVPRAGHWLGVKAFQAEEEWVQKHK